MVTRKYQKRCSPYANDMQMIHFFSILSRFYPDFFSPSFDSPQRFLFGCFFSVFLSAPSLIIRPYLIARLFIRPLLFPAFLNFNPLDTWRPSWKTTVMASFHSSHALFPSDIFCSSLNELIQIKITNHDIEF